MRCSLFLALLLFLLLSVGGCASVDDTLQDRAVKRCLDLGQEAATRTMTVTVTYQLARLDGTNHRSFGEEMQRELISFALQILWRELTDLMGAK
ncbi:MAG TPA: hypothetical protein PKD37_03800 [Oligoflexia bacterium]|nr:hypothetical protein [Oligoflexia bacterium]HMP27091.1 hypothetical protein [Oligoflexia bacterium]